MRPLRSSGNWLILIGTLGAAVAAAVEGRVGPVAIAGVALIVTGGVISWSAPLLFARRSGTLVVPRALRIGVPVTVAVLGGISTSVIIEGHTGPVTRASAVALLVGGLVAIMSALLYASDAGVARFSLRHRIGVPIVVLAVVVLAGTVVFEDGWGDTTALGLALAVSVASVRTLVPALHDASGHRRWYLPPELRITALLVVAVLAVLGVALALDARSLATFALAVTTFVLALAWRLAIPTLYGTDSHHHWRYPRPVRVHVLSWSAIVAGLWVLVLVEGSLGPITLTVAAGLALMPLLRVLVPALYGLNGRGVRRLPIELRLGVAIVAVFVLGLGALASSLEAGSSDVGAATVEDDVALGDVDVLDASASESTEHRWDTVGDRFVDPTCAEGGPFDRVDGVATPRAPLDVFAHMAVSEQLDVARFSAAQLPTVADAIAAGFRQASPPLPCVGTYFIDWAIADGDLGRVDGDFDPAHPEILRYEGTDPESPLVGVSYMITSEQSPSGFRGGHDHWHRYPGLCVAEGMIAGVGVPAESCAGGGQRWFPGEDLWVLHAWVVPGWENPLGAFAAGHRRLG